MSISLLPPLNVVSSQVQYSSGYLLPFFSSGVLREPVIHYVSYHEDRACDYHPLMDRCHHPTLADALAVDEVAAGVFVHAGRSCNMPIGDNRGDIANMGFIVGAEAVAVIDTGNSPAIGKSLRGARSGSGPICRSATSSTRTCIRTISSATPPLRKTARLSSPMPVSNPALMARADSYQRRLEEDLGAEEARGATMAAPRGPSSRHRRALKLDLGGGRVIELTAWPPAHTNND